MPNSEEELSNVIKLYKNRLNQYHNPTRAYEETVKELLGHRGYSVKEILTLFGKNPHKFPQFDPSLNRHVNEWAKELYRVPLHTFLERRNSSVNKLQEILTIYYLRHLQELEWEQQDDYISYDRVFLDAENYDYNNLAVLTTNHFLNYENINLKDYQKEIEDILYNIEKHYSEQNLSPRALVEELKEYAHSQGYLRTFIESPDRLKQMPNFYDESSGPKWGERDQGGAVRFAPTPNGPLHIGHGRGISLLGDYADKYNMEFYLRFDDTNQDEPSKSSDLPDAFNIEDVYTHIIEDVTWILGKPPDEIIYASDEENLLRYEESARELIKNEYAFVLFEIVKGEEYKYGKSPEENLQMFEEMLIAGSNPPWNKASVILGVGTGYNNSKKLYMRKPPHEETEFHHVERVKEMVKKYIKNKVYSGSISNNELAALNNTGDGSKIMGNQKVQNIRVIERGDEQWVWPNLSLQSVVDDAYYGVTHALRGTDYDLDVAIEKKDVGVQHTIYFQGILRMLLGAPPIYTASNWGNVSWDGWIWNYDKSGKSPIFLNEKTSNMSTSIIKLGIMDERYEKGFLTPGLPTIYNLRRIPDNRGSSFKFYWTRFDLPNSVNPTFIRGNFHTLNEQLKISFPRERELDSKNKEIIEQIETLQQENKYLAEERR
tara:strand:+ start:52245 stop:54218 length:1974 start_codon:yes stop_codon:yes gene_type:complete